MPSLIASLGLNISRFAQGLRQAEGEARKGGNSIAKSLGREMSGKLAAFAGAAAIGESIRRTMEYADKVGDAGKRTSVAVEALQAWDMALKQSGSSIDDAIPFFEKLAVAKQKALKGDEQAIESFKAFGISIDQLKSKRVEDLGLQIAKAFESGDPQKLIADLREIGGRGAGELVAAFREGLAGMVEANQESTSIMSKEAIEQLKSVGDSFTSLWAEVRAGIGTIVAPPLSWLVRQLVYAKDLIAMNAAAAGGFSVGGFKGAQKAASDYQDMINKRDAKQESEQKEVFDKDQETSKKEKEIRSHKEAGHDRLEKGSTPHNKELTELQKIGGAYVSAPEHANAALDVSRQQLRQLERIDRNIEAMAKSTPASTASTVKFG